jgi:hypothetical protein
MKKFSCKDMNQMTVYLVAKSENTIDFLINGVSQIKTRLRRAFL